MPVISFAQATKRLRRLPRIGERVTADQFDAEYWHAIASLDEWLGAA
jgi:hypothetical protein